MRSRLIHVRFLCVFVCAGLLFTLPNVLSEHDDCQICKDVLQFASDALLLGNSTIDELDKHLLDFAIKTGLCGAKGRIGAVDVCEGALNEYGKLVAQIVDQSPIRTLAEIDLCTMLRFCPLPPQPRAHPVSRRAPLLPLSASDDRSKPDTATSVSNIGHFTVITDIHWDPFYSVGSITDCDHPMCCRANYGPRLNAAPSQPAGKWGDYACDPPWVIVNATLAFAASLPSDFVVFTGDGPPHDVWNQSASYNMDTIDTLMALLRVHFPSTPVFPSVGNHDTFPCDQFSIDQTGIYSSIASSWSRFLPPPALQTVAQGAFYSTTVMPGLRAIALNSMWGDPIDFWVSLGNVTNTYEREFIESEMQKARENKEKVILLGHIPIGVVDTESNHIQAMANWTRWYESLSIEFEDVIVGHFAGHTHKDEKRVVFDSQGNAASVMYVLPSVSTFTERNPSITSFQYDKSTFELLDYTVYFANLSLANARDNAEFVEFYSAKAYFGLPDLSPTSWSRAFQSILTNSTAAQRYLDAYFSGMHARDVCDDACVKHHYCSSTTLYIPEWQACMAARVSPRAFK